jgi:hypothetical protein
LGKNEALKLGKLPPRNTNSTSAISDKPPDFCEDVMHSIIGHFLRVEWELKLAFLTPRDAKTGDKVTENWMIQ